MAEEGVLSGGRALVVLGVIEVVVEVGGKEGVGMRVMVLLLGVVLGLLMVMVYNRGSISGCGERRG